MANPIIPRDINSAEPALRSEFISYIEQLIDAAQPATGPRKTTIFSRETRTPTPSTAGPAMT